MDSLKKLSVVLVCASLAHTCSAQSAPTDAGRRCYYPNGDVILNDRPCDPDAEHSACCGAGPPFGVACLSNKLCKSEPGDVGRGSCTDPTWQSPECPSFCLENIASGNLMTPCSNVTEGDAYVCGESADLCDSDISRLTLGASPPHTWAEWVDSLDGYAVVTPLSSSSTRTSATSATASMESDSSRSSASISSTTNTSSTPPTETATSGDAEETQPPTSSEPSPSESPTQTPGSSTAAQAGIGLGAAVGALLVGVVAYL